MYGLADYTLEKRLGCSVTLRFTTRDISSSGDTVVTVGSDYRYTVVDTAFLLRDSLRCIAVKRETITNGEVRLTDTTYQWVGPRDLIMYERLADTIGRRRLAEPLSPGTRLILRENLGSVESNTYVIQTMKADVVTTTGTLRSCAHVRMASSTDAPEGTTSFSDEVWLAPNLGVVKQLQTRTFKATDSTSAPTTILEFILIARS
ncbi:MAG: hypothetical protein KA339_10495 [Candidatus Kapabacteria bacterium]|nr:hypothetical protein [Ignavibacteria bacterium]MBK7413568.1 hypothetical protein [Ignavibacteria bacterium]MBP6510980.1 hypothetical protein [Candidatus Kapabacteria bacterium]MBP7093165.1 hypothetical protein [Candidatus Kapabacteria bacterium]